MSEPGFAEPAQPAVGPPDWRWRAALARQDAPLTTGPAAGDAGVRRAAQFLRALRRCATPAHRHDLARRMPIVSGAHAISSARNPAPRHALEARLLANEARAAIATKSGLALSTVRCYEQLFFDLGARHGSPDFVLTCILGPGLHEANWTYDLFWKFFAYFGGAAVLDVVLHGCPPTARPQSFGAVVEFLADSARLAVRRQMTRAACALAPANGRLAQELVRLQAELAVKQAASGEGTPQNLIEQHIAAMLQEFPWACGADGAASVAPPVAAYDTGAVELRDDELQRVSAGEKLPYLDELMKLRMPPPRPKSATPGVEAPAASQQHQEKPRKR